MNLSTFPVLAFRYLCKDNCLILNNLRNWLVQKEQMFSKFNFSFQFNNNYSIAISRSMEWLATTFYFSNWNITYITYIRKVADFSNLLATFQLINYWKLTDMVSYFLYLYCDNSTNVKTPIIWSLLRSNSWFVNELKLTY